MKSMIFNIRDQDIDHMKKGTIKSLNPVTFDVFPSKEKRKYILACFLVHGFKKDKIYTEAEVNDILMKSHVDYASVRRFMIDYAFLKRSDDCSSYWLNVELKDFARFQ